ncbi:hypothetical protein [Bifidobacterium callitrichidarum]|uniref:hypothetical protein n=1 Tax=Bifidobacterium callitrichidarum TaxID=2052941 RepID=UPI0011B21E52|nr:hypothetical protein [Bifidobacterium callitrichidarum]
MGFRDEPLTAAQHKVLVWIGEGCPSDVFDDYSPRISARALSNRGLVTITGHGKQWSASLTKDGTFYLQNGRYPDTTESHKSGTNIENTSISNQTINPSLNMPSGNPQSPKRPENPKQDSADNTVSITEKHPIEQDNPPQHNNVETRQKTNDTTEQHNKNTKTEQFINDLIQAGLSGIAVPPSEEHHYRHMAGTAKRYKKIPSGMKIVFVDKLSANNCTLCVALIPKDTSESVVLTPVPIPHRLSQQNTVVQTMADSKTFRITGETRHRALLCLSGLVTAAEADNMTVESAINVVTDDYRYYQPDAPRHDEIHISLGDDTYRVWLEQPLVRQRHEPTRREINLVSRGILFPDYDEYPGEQLVLQLREKGSTNWSGYQDKVWGKHWADNTDHKLEDDLPEVLEAIRLRHNDLVLQRRKEAERLQQEQEKRDRHERALAAAREEALAQYRRKQTTDSMIRQARNWRDSNLLMEYAIALEQAARTHPSQRHELTKWASEIREYAAVINPIPDGAHPELSEPTTSDLQPIINLIMKGR